MRDDEDKQPLCYKYELGRCFVCYGGAPASRICAECWGKHRLKCQNDDNRRRRRRYEEGINPMFQRMTGVDLVDVSTMLELDNSWPKTERAMNLLKYGPMQENDYG